MSSSSAVRLRSKLQGAERQGPGRGWPRSLRTEVVAFVRSRGPSASLTQMAAELGVPAATLARWMRKAAPSACADFRPVQLIEGDVRDRSSSYTLLGPCGLRVEGLSLDALAALLRKVAS